MATNIYTSYIQSILLSCITATILSCGTIPEEDYTPVNIADNEEVMPEEMWISDAENWLNLDVKKETLYTLYAPIFDTKREVEMHFNSNHHLFLIRILNDPGFRHDLYCEEGRVAFSEHYDQNNNAEWLMAYANGKVYAAALKSDEKWKGISPGDVHLRPQLIESALKCGIVYQNKEAALLAPTRIFEDRSEIAGAFKDKISIPFVLNARKGDQINIQLDDESENAYFTIDAGKGSNMEHQRWKGLAVKTGDLAITVFSVEPKSDRKFKLKTEISPQNRDYAQAK